MIQKSGTEIKVIKIDINLLNNHASPDGQYLLQIFVNNIPVSAFSIIKNSLRFLFLIFNNMEQQDLL